MFPEIGEWELWTDAKYTKTGAWPVGGVAMCDLESNSSIRNPGPIDWVHFHVPRDRGMGTVDRCQVHKNGGMACRRSRHVRPRVEFKYSKPGPHRLGPFPCSPRSGNGNCGPMPSTQKRGHGL